MTATQKSLYSPYPLPLPEGTSEDRLFEWLNSVRVEGSGDEIANYLKIDFQRFVQTLGLVSKLEGKGGHALEFGANPYFTTMLLRQFTKFDWIYSNYFGPHMPRDVCYQSVRYKDYATGETVEEKFAYHHFNTECDRFPLEESSLNLVLYCEILEHLLHDPCKVLRGIHGLLRPEGHLVLTTPNVARMENVMRMIDGANIYDPYSGYGPYGRHNREYTCQELTRLLKYVGFEIEQLFTADVHPHQYNFKGSPDVLRSAVSSRSGDLGQYIFIRARKSGLAGKKNPDWLYRSLPQGQLAKSDDDKHAQISAQIDALNPLEISHEKKTVAAFTITNSGIEAWTYPDLKIGARVYTRDGEVVREFRGGKIGQLVPGEKLNASVDVDLESLGYEKLEVMFDIVNEHQFWFSDMGSEPYRVIV